MPNRICDTCYKEIENWIKFKQKCSKANSELKDYLENLDSVKIEVSKSSRV